MGRSWWELISATGRLGEGGGVGGWKGGGYLFEFQDREVAVLVEHYDGHVELAELADAVGERGGVSLVTERPPPPFKSTSP